MAGTNLFGTPVELAPYVAAAAKRTAAVAITALKQSLRSERRPIDAVLLVGGGAAVYAEAVRDAFPKARVILPDDPVLANVRGFWAYAGETGAEAVQPQPDTEPAAIRPPNEPQREAVEPPAQSEAEAVEPPADPEPEAVEPPADSEPEAAEADADSEPEAVDPPNPARVRAAVAASRPAPSAARAAPRAPIRGKRGKGG